MAEHDSKERKLPGPPATRGIKAPRALRPLARLFDLLAGLLFLGFAATIRRLPIPVADRVGALVGDLAWWLVPSRRAIARANLALAFPDRAPRDRHRIARRTFRNLGRTLTDFCRFPVVDRAWVERHVRIEGMEHARESLRRARGVLALSAHFGCFEMIAAAINLTNLCRTSLVGRPIRNPIIDQAVRAYREATGVATIPIETGMREVFQRLKNREGIGIVLDQRWKRSQAVSVDFFGHPAPTAPALALMAQRTRAPVLPIFMIREGPGRHVLRFLPIVEYEEREDREEAIRVNTQRYTDVIESMVRAHPDHWMWLHSRWARKDEMLRRMRGGDGADGQGGGRGGLQLPAPSPPGRGPRRAERAAG